MKSLRLFATLLAALVSFAGTSRAQQPPDAVSSDACYNTAMGTAALLNNNNGTGCSSSGGNTASGDGALQSNTTGAGNTASGAFALLENATGVDNTASGINALGLNTTGSHNTASGESALYSNTSANFNSAFGAEALYNNSGNYNTASGAMALYSNTTGHNNTAVGYQALYSSQGAQHNSAFGYQTLYSDSTGQYNNAMGDNTLAYNTQGNNNNAVGYAALYSNTTGSSNNAQGYYALARNTTGSSNTALGEYAGYNQTTGSNNIYIGNQGVSGENAVIRIGNPTNKPTTYIAGITGTNVTGGATVVVNSNGQLGVMSSSREYKEDIRPLDGASERLYELRPVAFRYRQADERGERPIQYGLVAEEVADTFPELVVKDAAGRPATVAYQVLPTLLLNELQKEHRRAQAQSDEIADLKAQVAALQRLTSQLAAPQLPHEEKGEPAP